LFGPTGRRVVVVDADQVVRWVLGRHHTGGVIVRVHVPGPVAEPARPRVVGVAQVRGHRAAPAGPHVRDGGGDGGRGGGGRGGGGEVDHRVCEVELGLGHAHLLDRAGRGHGDLQGGRDGRVHNLAGGDELSPGDAPGVLPRRNHPGQVRHGGIYSRPTLALDERACGVVVDVALPVVPHRLHVDGPFGDLQVDLVRDRPGR